MIVIQSFANFITLLFAPFHDFFETFTEFAGIIKGIVVLSLGYFGWRAIK